MIIYNFFIYLIILFCMNIIFFIYLIFNNFIREKKNIIGIEMFLRTLGANNLFLVMFMNLFN